MKPSLLILSFILGFSGQVCSWGANGHRAVGEIAQQHLTSKAKKKIGKILNCKPLAEIATWMDDIKSDDAYDHTHDWHWVTIPAGQEYHQTKKNKKGDILQKIEEFRVALKSGNLSSDQEREYLSFLVHLVGDIHQPLHVGNGIDAGGNKVKVKWFGKSSNLHRVWDSDMIESKQLSFTELVRFIGTPSKGEIALWQNAPVVEWAKESAALSDAVYELPENKRLGYDYLYKNFPTVKLRILQAGVRLAGILNDIYG